MSLHRGIIMTMHIFILILLQPPTWKLIPPTLSMFQLQLLSLPGVVGESVSHVYLRTNKIVLLATTLALVLLVAMILGIITYWIQIINVWMFVEMDFMLMVPTIVSPVWALAQFVLLLIIVLHVLEAIIIYLLQLSMKDVNHNAQQDTSHRL